MDQDRTVNAHPTLPPAANVPGKSRRGIVLIVVTVAIVMIGLAGMSFVAIMSTEHKAVHVHGDELQLAGLVDSGAELLGVVCELPPAGRQRAGGLLDNPGLFRGRLVFEDQRTVRRGRFSVVAPNVQNGEITGMRFGAENESARLNLAVLLRWEQQHPGAAHDALMNLPGMTEAAADAILDWIDADSTPRRLGAEADYYAGANVPYGPRNSVPASIEELLLVRGVTRELFLGGDANFNHQLEPQEVQIAGAGPGGFQSGAPLRWASYLTVYSAQRNLRPDGEPRIDLNDDDLKRLHGGLEKLLDAQWARFVVLFRQLGPYQAEDADADGRDAVADAPTVRVDFSRPAKFKIATVLDLIAARVQLPAEGADPAPRVIESPLADDPAALRDYLPQLMDHTTTVSAKVIRGRVNVNLAPRAVLLGVPGLDAALVEQIVVRRGSSAARGDPGRRHPTWLLTEGLVELDQMKSLLQYLTCGGDVYRAQIVGFFDRPGPSTRVELVLDATVTPPRRVYWKDLRLLGRGYSLTALGAEPPSGTLPVVRQIR